MRALLALLLVAAPARAEWREMRVDPGRLTDDVTRAVKGRWGRRLRDFSVDVRGPKLITDGETIHARFESLTIHAHKWYVGDMPVRGRIDFGPGEVDYARLGVGELEVVGEVHGKVYIRIDHSGLAELLADGGFEDIGYEWVEKTKEFVIWGYRPVKLLFFRLRPRIKVRLRAFLEGTDVGFRGIQVFISAIPRFIERIIERRINKRLGERLHLQKDFDKVAKQGIRAAGGVVEIYDKAGKLLLHVDMPADPKLTP
jgi:hypothetical protein